MQLGVDTGTRPLSCASSIPHHTPKKKTLAGGGELRAKFKELETTLVRGNVAVLSEVMDGVQTAQVWSRALHTLRILKTGTDCLP